MEIEALSAWLPSEAEQPRIKQLPVLKRGDGRERVCAVQGEEQQPLVSGEGAALGIGRGCASLHVGLGGDPMEVFFPFALLLQLRQCLAQPRKAWWFRLRSLPLPQSAVI